MLPYPLSLATAQMGEPPGSPRGTSLRRPVSVTDCTEREAGTFPDARQGGTRGRPSSNKVPVPAAPLLLPKSHSVPSPRAPSPPPHHAPHTSTSRWHFIHGQAPTPQRPKRRAHKGVALQKERTCPREAVHARTSRGPPWQVESPPRWADGECAWAHVRSRRPFRSRGYVSVKVHGPAACSLAAPGGQ